MFEIQAANRRKREFYKHRLPKGQKTVRDEIEEQIKIKNDKRLEECRKERRLIEQKIKSNYWQEIGAKVKI